MIPKEIKRELRKIVKKRSAGFLFELSVRLEAEKLKKKNNDRVN